MPSDKSIKNNFAKTKALFKSSISSVIDSRGINDILSESAFPAYANKNPFIDRLFWRRVREVYYYLAEKSENENHGEKILDFGCGSGVLSYALAKLDTKVYAFDITLQPVELLKKFINFPENISFHEGDISVLGKYEDESFDYIAALDVFEHISDLDPYIKVFRRILKKGGEMVVSGPTENFMYKLGRKLAGKNYSGDYHETSIVQVRKKFESESEVRMLGTLYPFLPLFEIFTVRF